MRRLLAAAALLACVAGCTRALQTPPSERRPWTIPHVLRAVELTEPDRLNPYLSQMDISYDLTSLLYSYLVVADDRGRLTGDLAAAVPSLANGGISNDGKTYTYHLRRGVRWQDGARFTSADVVASWKAVVDPHNLTIYRQGYDRVASIDTPDPYTAIVHLRERYPPFVTQFFAPLQEGGKPILPAHILASEGDFNRGSLTQRPVGTGPFEFVSWQRGDRIVLRRFDGYFRGRPKLERIELSFVPSSQTIMTQVRLHQVDLWITPPAALYPEYSAFDGVAVYTVPWNQQGLVVVNGGKPGLSDPVVRRAISLALDRSAILQRATHGVDEIPRDAIAPTAVGYEKRRLVYDPAAANALLDAAGWVRGADGVRAKNGVRLEFTIATISGSSTYEEIALLMQPYLKAIGIALQIKAYPYNQIFDFAGPIDTYAYDLAIYGSALNWDPDTHVYFGCDQWFPKGQNFYKYCNADYDRLEAQALQTDDPAARAALYKRADAIVWDTAAYLPIFESRRIVVRNPDLKNYKPNPTSTPWWNAWEWDI
jgi:peptide/nickel transport system substrate-binding protein